MDNMSKRQGETNHIDWEETAGHKEESQESVIP